MSTANQEIKIVQLQSLRLPMEIISSNDKGSEAIQLPIMSFQSDSSISNTKQAFFAMASQLPMINLDDEYNDSENNYTDCNDPEILLTDSDEEDEAGFMETGEEARDAETCIDSEELNDSVNDEDSMSSEMDTFDEPRSSFELNESQVYKSRSNI